MTIALRYAARSDVGLLREGNEDSAYASSRLLAVADGMGGHAHGEVASSVAIAALSSLDEDAHGGDLLSAIEAAVRNANRQLHDMVARDPSLKGMGTTLTAMLWNGAEMALVHVGDSRAYLLRNGELYQITHDHTLVQSLVDDGRITQEEAATHPQRSILLRALDGSGEVDPDLTLRVAQVNDRYLLCSDGLSTVVSAETLHHTLTTYEDPEAAVRQLIDLANRGGGPDNITCIVADVIEVDDVQQLPTTASIVGAAGATRLSPPDFGGGRASTITAPQPVLVDVDDDPAGETAFQPAPRPVKRRRMWPMVVATLVVVAAGLGVGGWYASQWINDHFYVGADKDEIVVYQGIDAELGPVQLFQVRHRSKLAVSALPQAEQGRVRDGIAVSNLAAGISEISKLREASAPPDGQNGDGTEQSPAADDADAAKSGGEADGDQKTGNEQNAGNQQENEQQAKPSASSSPTRRTSG
jgi:serine/threonine protein phosphatase PrpC